MITDREVMVDILNKNDVRFYCVWCSKITKMNIHFEYMTCQVNHVCDECGAGDVMLNELNDEADFGKE